MNEFIARFLNFISVESLMERGWLEVAQIIMPVFVLTLVFLGLSFFIRSRRLKTAVSILCALLALIYMPYEFYRQSNVHARADANITEVQTALRNLLDSAHLAHVKEIADKEAATGMLDDMIHGLDQGKKKELVLISWLMAENEQAALGQLDGKQQLLAEDIKSNLQLTKNEIIDSRPPVEKISDTIVRKLDEDIKALVENKMGSFKQEIDDSLDGFKEDINTFVQGELKNYQTRLASITQQNVDELRNYSNKANQAFADQINKINQVSLKKLDDTKGSIEGLGTASETNLKNITQQVKQLSASLELAQKKNDILFEYNECMRTAGVLDLGGKGEQCRAKYDRDMNSLKQ